MKKKKKKSFNRFTALFIMMILIFTAITSRLTYLQVVKAEDYKEKANRKSITEIQEFAPRGEIKDRNGSLLATNQKSYILTYTETDESKLNFFQTMDKVFKVLDENKEVQQDDFELKINPYRFEFKVQDEDARKQIELRFKKDRGLDEEIIKKLYPKVKDTLSEEQQEKVDEELLKITPEQTFKYLVDQYKLTPKDTFKNIVEQYSDSPNDTLQLIKNKYKISSESEVKTLLDQYVKDKKKSKEIFEQLVVKCGVDKLNYTIDQQRRYMLVKDTQKMQSFSGYKPVEIAKNINQDTAFIFSQMLNDMPGIDISIQPIRYYPYDELGSAFLGYISKINSSSKDKYDEKGYDSSTDYVGAAGLERAFEDKLKGSKGGRIVKLNKQGRVTEELGSRESYPGQTLQLTIDKDVQYAAEVALDKTMESLQKAGVQEDVDTSNATRGAAVAIDVNTGGILALVSRPGFNPNDFAKGLTEDQYKKYFSPDYTGFGKLKGYNNDKINQLFPMYKDTNIRYDKYDVLPKPLYNYATLSLTQPGSTFKPLTAIAGLEKGVINTSTTVDDEGFFDDGNGFNTKFPSDGRNGIVNLTTAIAKSSNPYFMTVSQRLRAAYGDDVLADYAWKFGLGVKPNSGQKPTTGIEFASDEENFGQVFNSYTIKNNYATSYLANCMDLLKSGKSSEGNTFTPINLYFSDSDSDEVKQIKKDFKDQISAFIKNGGWVEGVGSKDDKNSGIKRDTYVMNTYSNLINKLIAADSNYKGKNISKSEISSMSYDLLSISIYDGYFQSTAPFNIYNASIGQGISNFTPLQLANYVATMVNGGNRYKLHLVDKITDANGNIIQDIKPEVVENTGVKQSTLDAIKAGMLAVTDKGTAAGAFAGLPFQTAGKTGSATFRNDQADFGRTSYAVYVGFAPYDKPQIAVAVIIFDGGHGGFITPVARAMYEAYFKDQLKANGVTPQSDIEAKPIN